ncbi:MAG: acetyl-CoA carboxylase biotin carboxylase subunit [Bdellovibrionia bacterium]
MNPSLKNRKNRKNRKPLLIANRGEIAIRIARTARALGFPTVAIYSDADRFAEHLRFCDQAIGIGAAPPKESYLNIERVIDAALRSQAQYVHPGYGFLSERAHFVEACEKAGLTFVGPRASHMRQMGDKIQARATVDSLGVPRVPGSAGALADAEQAKTIAAQIGYPVLLKAAAGGGGKGMRRVDSNAEMESSFASASREALGAFGDGSLYVEKLILEPHHVEIQIFGDGQGGAVHLGDRECSIQRRHQKVWEEAPAPILHEFPETRVSMVQSAVRIAEKIQYSGAGTFEFIVDGQGNYYFLEMNTRLQVEHPVTEWVSGVDLVEWQLLLAAGELKLPLKTPPIEGHAIEVRLYAEDPETFLPAPGQLGSISLPSGAFVRSDTAFVQEGEVSLFYDPMIAKVSVWGASRAQALSRLQVALGETRVEPPKRADGSARGSLRTNLPFLKRLAFLPEVIQGQTTTHLIADHKSLTEPCSADLSWEAALAVAIHQIVTDSQGSFDLESSSLEAEPSSRAWSQSARRHGGWGQ